MKKIIVILIVILTVMPKVAFTKNCNLIERLIGQWESTNKTKIISELWQKVSSDTYEGIGTTKLKKDKEIIASESLRIVNMNEDIFYIAKVKHNNLPIAFKLTTCSENYLKFENKQHDFPKQLIYTWIDKDKLMIDIRGENNKGFSLQMTQKNK